jgi:hypothetical protein
MRRLLVVLAVIAGFLVAAVPAMAATYHTRESGTGMSAYFSDVQFDGEGNLVPGTYREAWVYAATRLATGDDPWEDRYACAESWTFTIDDQGNWIEEEWVGGCGPYELLTVTRQLTEARVVATIPVEDCLAWSRRTGECREWGLIGTFEVDLAATGAGPLSHWHDTSSGGSAGSYQYTYHGTGTERAAAVAGTFLFDDSSLTDGATFSGGWMFSTKTGWVDVWH